MKLLFILFLLTPPELPPPFPFQPLPKAEIVNTNKISTVSPTYISFYLPPFIYPTNYTGDYTLQVTTNLVTWEDLAMFHGRIRLQYTGRIDPTPHFWRIKGR